MCPPRRGGFCARSSTWARVLPCPHPALKCFHGPLQYQMEMEDIERERVALGGEKPKKPWELFADRSVRWQLITIFLMPMGQQLSGINAVRMSPAFPKDISVSRKPPPMRPSVPSYLATP